MQIDKIDAAKKTAIIATAIGVTVAAPYAAPFVLWALSPLLTEIGKAGLETVKGVGSNALWDLKDSFEASHENEDLTRLLGKAYSAAMADVLEQAENDLAFGNFNDLIKLILPSIKEELDKHLATGREIDLLKLFPNKENLIEIEIEGQKKLPFYKRLFGKQPVEYKPVGKDLLANITSEEFILKISDDSEAAKKLVSEEVEITLRRWFTQLNPKLAENYTFPPSLNKFVFEKIGELIPEKINRLVKQDDLEHSWKAFQRSHLQAILSEVKNQNNGLSTEDRKLLEPLGEFLHKLSENNELIAKLADGTSEILSRVGESEENLKNCIAEESRKLKNWLDSRLDAILAVGNETLETSRRTEKTVIELKEIVTQAVAPEKEGIELNLVSLPNRYDRIYGRDNEIKEILQFLRDEKKHGAIVLPTCYGKTSLIKKFLYQTTATTEVKTEFQPLFEKIIYIFCYQNQNFRQIIRPFASLMGKRLEYTEGDEANFLKQDVFDQIQHQKILLIIDNFESWIDENDKYLNTDVAVFLETLFNSNHQIRTIFVSQRLPHREKDFDKKTVEIKEIEKALLKGLDEKSALKLVRTEGEDEDFRYVSDADLIGFFKKVYYIPQAIQSMLAFIDDEAVTFTDLMTEFWAVFQTGESDETDLEDQIPKELRPTRALLKHQVDKLDEHAKHLLCLTAFFDSVVPEEILLNDFGNYKKNDFRKSLDRLAKHKLMLKETDEQPETDENTRAKSAIHYYQLHGFVSDVIKEMFPAFADENTDNFTVLADQMDKRQEAAWEKKLFNKQFALVTCWERLETELVINKKLFYRQYFLDLIDFNKALAFQELSFAADKQLSSDELKGRIEFIENLYHKWLAKHPDDSTVYNNLGTLLDKDEKRQAEAEAMYRKAIELNPFDDLAYNNLGILLEKDESRWLEAEESYRMSIELSSYSTKAYNNLGLLLAKNEKRLPEAEELYRKAIEVDADHFETHYNLGNLLVKDEKRWSEAEAIYRSVIEINPNYEKAYYGLGQLLAKDSLRMSEAEEMYRKAIELNPNYKDAYNSLGVLLSEDKNRWAEAEALYWTANAFDQNDAMIYFNLGVLIDNDENRLPEAEEMYRKAIELKPNYTEAFCNLGNLIAKDTNRLSEAEELYRKAIETNPDYEMAYYNLGVLFTKDPSRYAEAEELFRKAIELNPNYAEAYYNLGTTIAKDASRYVEGHELVKKSIELNIDVDLIYRQFQDQIKNNDNLLQESIERFNAVIELNPDNAEAYFGLGFLLMQDPNRLDEAEEKFAKAIELNPHYAEVYYITGLLLFDNPSRRQESEAYFKKAIELDINNTEAYQRLGFLLCKKGNYSEAIINFEEALKIDQNFFQAHLALAGVFKKQGNFKKSKEHIDQGKPFIKDDDYYNLACLNSILGNKEKAFEYLHLVIEQNPSAKLLIKDDMDFDFIRDDERFKEIVGD